MRQKHKIVCIGLLLVLLLAAVFAPHKTYASSDTSGQTGTIRLMPSGKAYPGVKFTIYQVAVGRWVRDSEELTDDFKESHLSLTAETLGDSGTAKSIAAYIRKNHLKGLSEKTLDANGSTEFSGLEDGIYFILQTNTEADFDKLGYTVMSTPYFVEMPQLTDDSGASTYTVESKPKYHVESLSDSFVDISVYKDWKDNNNYYGKRPKSIRAALYNGSEKVYEVTLSAENNWSYTWKGLDIKGDWKVSEVAVPSGYTSQVTKEGNDFTIVNTYTPPGTTGVTTPPGTTKSVKTGDDFTLGRYAILFAASALAIMILRKKKTKDKS